MLFLSGVFALGAWTLAVIGTYAVTAQAVASQRREIGIRLALGAQTRSLLKLVTFQGMKLALIGVGIGLVLAFFVTRFMVTMLFGVEPTDATTFGAITAILIGVALLACYIPARRATRVDPLVALKSE